MAPALTFWLRFLSQSRHPAVGFRPRSARWQWRFRIGVGRQRRPDQRRQVRGPPRHPTVAADPGELPLKHSLAGNQVDAVPRSVTARFVPSSPGRDNPQLLRRAKGGDYDVTRRHLRRSTALAGSEFPSSTCQYRLRPHDLPIVLPSPRRLRHQLDELQRG